MKLSYELGTTDNTVLLKAVDSNGAAATVAHSSANLEIWYARDGGAKATVSVLTGTAALTDAITDPHADGGFIHKYDGWHRVDYPDAAFAAGAAFVTCGFTSDDGNAIERTFHLKTEKLYDALVAGTINQEVNTVEVEGDAPSATPPDVKVVSFDSSLLTGGKLSVSADMLDGDASAMDTLVEFVTVGADLGNSSIGSINDPVILDDAAHGGASTTITLSTPIEANAVQLSGDGTAADNAEAAFDGTGYGFPNTTIPTVTNVTNGVSVSDFIRCKMVLDRSGSKDTYTFIFERADGAVTSTGDITAGPTISVRNEDGTTLVSTTGALSALGSIPLYKHDETTNRKPSGENVTAIVSATIDGEARVFYVPLNDDVPNWATITGISNQTTALFNQFDNTLVGGEWTAESLVNVPKTGYKLASDGLDSVSTNEPTGVAGNFREMVVQTWRRFFKKTTYNRSTEQVITYRDDGTTPTTTQSATDDGTTQQVGDAS